MTGNLVEVSTTGKQVAAACWTTPEDHPGAGALFGLAAVEDGSILWTIAEHF
jgi:hypothetical protein